MMVNLSPFTVVLQDTVCCSSYSGVTTAKDVGCVCEFSLLPCDNSCPAPQVRPPCLSWNDCSQLRCRGYSQLFPMGGASAPRYNHRQIVTMSHHSPSRMEVKCGQSSDTRNSTLKGMLKSHVAHFSTLPAVIPANSSRQTARTVSKRRFRVAIASQVLRTGT